jgi:hypothetical protein
MIADIASQAVAMQASRFQQAASLAVMKKSFEMEKMTAQMLVDSVSQAPAPTGQGLRVDKRA